MGFLREADDIQNYAGITYNSVGPFGIFRKASVGYKHWRAWDFEGNFNYFDWDIEANGIFNNNWSATLGWFSQPHIYSKSLLRGGPRLYLPEQYGAWWALGSDSTKRLFFNWDGWTKTGDTDSYFLLENGISVTWQPLDQLQISLAPQYTAVRHRIQYNETVNFNNEQLYIMSRLDQDTFSMAFRLNYTINPNLSIQYYAEPFVTTARYTDFGKVVEPLATVQNEQLAFYNEQQLARTNEQDRFLVDENQNGLVDYSFSNPDFSFAQFRSNLVVRFEYKPGSEIFLVWAQDVADFGMPNGGVINSFREQIFNKQARNTFLIKATYRFF